MMPTNPFLCRTRHVAPAPTMHIVTAAQQQQLEENEASLRPMLMQLPTCVYAGPAGGGSAPHDDPDVECSLCLEAYIKGDILRVVRRPAVPSSLVFPNPAAASSCVADGDPRLTHACFRCRSCPASISSTEIASTDGCSVRSSSIGAVCALSARWILSACHRGQPPCPHPYPSWTRLRWSRRQRTVWSCRTCPRRRRKTWPNDPVTQAPHNTHCCCSLCATCRNNCRRGFECVTVCAVWLVRCVNRYR